MDTETRSLKCQLTDEEKRAKAEEAAKLSEDLTAAQVGVESAKGKVKTAQAHCDSIEATIMARLDTYKKGWESRQVECRWVPDKAAQKTRLVRSDTGEVVEEKEMPRQQKIDGVAETVPKKEHPALAGVKHGQRWGDDAGHVVTVKAVAADSVVVELSDGKTMRVPADDWGKKWHVIETITDLIPGGIAAEEPEDYTPIEKSEAGQQLLKALDDEGKTLDELADETRLAKVGLKGLLAVFVQRELAVEGKRTGQRGKPPVTYAITDKGKEAIES